jgi:hypothetical protein
MGEPTFPPTDNDLEIARRGVQFQWEHKKDVNAFLDHQAAVCAAYDAYIRGLTKILHKDLINLDKEPK